jgi:insulysin
LPSQDERARTDPLGYVSYHLAQPHPGGVASFLKRRGWASKLEAEAFTEMRSAGAVLVQVALTPAGLNHIDDIIATVLCTSLKCSNRASESHS